MNVDQLRRLRRRSLPLLMLVLFAWGIPRVGLPAGKQAARVKNGFDLRGGVLAITEIEYGGPPRDGIPALDAPDFVRASSGRSC